LFAAAARPGDNDLGFLLKSFLCIALVVLALQWREEETRPPATGARQRLAAPRPPRRPPIDETAHELVQSGADALVAAARDRCLASPRDCAAALQRLQGSGGGRE
jgi:hypothetical protein